MIKTKQDISKYPAPLSGYHFFRFVLALLFVLIVLLKQNAILPIAGSPIAISIIGIYTLYSTAVFSFHQSKLLQRVSIITFSFIDLLCINSLLYLSNINNLLLILSSLMVVMIAASLSPRRYNVIITLQAIILLSATYILHTLLNASPTLFALTSFLAVALSYFILTFLTGFLNKELQNQILQTQKKNREALKFRVLNKRIIEQMQTGILVLDADHNIVMFNKHSEELLNVALIENHHVKQFSATIFKGLIQDERGHIVFNNTLASPDTRASFSSIDHNNTTFTLIYLENNTKIHARAQEYKLSSLGRLTASIAHEIRNPLSAISYANQCLIDESSADEHDYSDLTAIINSNSGKINRIITDILNLARSPQMRREIITLNDWTNKFITQLQQSHTEPLLIETHIPSDTQIRFDPSALELIVTNICENGIYFSKLHTGLAKLTIKAETIDKVTCLCIRDYGAGVNDEDIDKLFEPFFTKRKDGTGLGLYITQQLCQINLATIKYSRGEAKDRSEFVITFIHPDKVNI